MSKKPIVTASDLPPLESGNGVIIEERTLVLNAGVAKLTLATLEIVKRYMVERPIDDDHDVRQAAAWLVLLLDRAFEEAELDVDDVEIALLPYSLVL